MPGPIKFPSFLPSLFPPSSFNFPKGARVGLLEDGCGGKEGEKGPFFPCRTSLYSEEVKEGGEEEKDIAS